MKKWLVTQKLILMRGYGWVNTPMIGVIFVGAVKTIFPTLVNTTPKAIVWGVVGLVGMYIVGYFDRRWKLYHAENNVVIETTPHLMDVVNRGK